MNRRELFPLIGAAATAALVPAVSGAAGAVPEPGPANPVWVTTREGGSWEEGTLFLWEEWQEKREDKSWRAGVSFEDYSNHWRVHSVGFDNGWIFDNYAGWRRDHGLLEYCAQLRQERAS